MGMLPDSAPPRSSGLPATWTARYAVWEARIGATFPGHSWRRANELNLATQCLALAAQQMLCTAPLLVAFSGVSQRFDQRGIGGVISRYLGLSKGASSDVIELFKTTTRIGNSATLFGLVAALIFATGVAATQQRGFELIWGQSRVGLRSPFRQTIWVIGLCLYLIVVLYAGRAGHRVGTHVKGGRPAGPGLQFLVSLLFFWWSQRLLLHGRVRWRRLLPGSVLMAVGMLVLVELSGPVMSGQITSQVTDYGLIGATFVLSCWLVVLSGVLFGGAMLGAVLAERRDARDELAATAATGITAGIATGIDEQARLAQRTPLGPTSR